MVRVPVYESNVELRPVHRQGVEGRGDPQAFGSGAGLVALGQGLGKLGAAIGEARELEDMTRAKDAENEFAKYMQERMYGENGYMFTQGKGAFESRQAFMEEAEKKRLEISASLKGGAQKKYNEASTVRMLNVNQQVLIHAGNEQKNWVKESSSARQELFAQDALNNIGNKEQINRHIAAGLLEMREQAKLEGTPAEALAVKEKAYVSGVQAGVILTLAQKDPLAAEEYMKGVENQLEPKDRYDLEQKLKEPIFQATAKKELRTADLQEMGGFNFSPTVQDAIGTASKKYGVPIEAMAVIAMIESKGNPNAKNPNSSAGGLYQQINSNARQYGVGNRYDPHQSADGAARFMRDNQIRLRRVLGREPTVGELYLAHQQGAGGAEKLLANPNARAVDIVGYEAVRLNGGNFQMTAQQFASLWINKAERIARGGMKAQQYIDSIRDPELRGATQALFDKRIAAQEQAEAKERDRALRDLDRQMVGYPQMDIDSLPIETQVLLGASGIEAVRRYQTTMLKKGEVETDAAAFLDLQDLFLNDPASFLKVDLLSYRDKLSNGDWAKAMGWRKEAFNDLEKTKEGNRPFSKAKKIAEGYLKAAGIDTTGKKGDDLMKVHQRILDFDKALEEVLGDFQRENGHPPNEQEMRIIVEQLMVPTYTIENVPRWKFWDGGKREEFLFDARKRKSDETVMARTDGISMSLEERTHIINDLVANGKPATEENIRLRYFEYMTSIGQVGGVLDEVVVPGEPSVEELREAGIEAQIELGHTPTKQEVYKYWVKRKKRAMDIPFPDGLFADPFPVWPYDKWGNPLSAYPSENE